MMRQLPSLVSVLLTLSVPAAAGPAESPAAIPVPEPAAFLMMGVLFLFILTRRRKGYKAKTKLLSR